MVKLTPFTVRWKLNYEGLIKNLRRQGTPDRVYFQELFLDREIQDAIDRRFSVTARLDPAAPDFEWRRIIAMQRFLGYETVAVALLGLTQRQPTIAADTFTGDQARKERRWINESVGLISTWEEFEKYPWPDGRTWNTQALEWFEKNLPDDMCILCYGGHFCEYLCWLMGYETLCYALYENRDLVKAIAAKILELEEAACKTVLQHPRVKIFWASDDMGHKTGTMLNPADMREFVLAGHQRLAQYAHAAGRPYLLHCCGNRRPILEDLIAEVKIDAVHSWEDTIEDITVAKRNYGRRLSLIGGIDVDFLCRADEAAIRKRVCETIEICQPGGGFCLGSGNSVANYIPLDNYLAMIDEGRKYC